MPLPLSIAPAPAAWEVLLPRVGAFQSPDSPFRSLAGPDEWTVPPALLRPLAPLLGGVEASSGEDFLKGLEAEKFAGADTLPAGGLRRTPLAWVGLELSEDGRQFGKVRGGCWVCGFPAVGRGRELLRAGQMGDAAGLGRVLGELGQPAPSNRLYFSFHYDEPQAACDRLYVLDSAAGRLHGFAFPPSALAPAKMK